MGRWVSYYGDVYVLIFEVFGYCDVGVDGCFMGSDGYVGCVGNKSCVFYDRFYVVIDFNFEWWEIF